MRQLSPPTHPTHPIVTVTCCHNDLGYLATLKAGNAESLRDFHHLSYFSYMFINHCRPPQEKQLLSHSQVRYGGITWRTLWCSEEKKTSIGIFPIYGSRSTYNGVLPGVHPMTKGYQVSWARRMAYRMRSAKLFMFSALYRKLFLWRSVLALSACLGKDKS